MSDLLGDPNIDPQAVVEPLRRAIGERYLTYALSTIMHRALPDARDGLKPVHRRILFAMRELRLSSTGGFRKSAKISGDVMGNYHPHGDAAIYDAMARLAQDFAVRYPLVDGQGNFGNIDGDNPAASRYTEARMTAVAEALLEGLNENAVDFRDNYDGTLREPIVLPAAFPNLLANGSSGIAVGMATNIPPHNIGELVDACLHIIATPDCRDDTLMNFVKGPDFPTGGVVVEPQESMAQAYRTGRGAFRLRCLWNTEDLGRGQWQIVVTEIPYQVQKSKLIEKLAELIQTKKVPILADVRDESADDVRIVLEPRSKNVEPDVLMGMLYRNSDLELRFSLNMNVLIDGVTPKVCSMKEVLRAFLDFRREVLIRRSRHRLQKIDHRLEVLQGLITAFLNLDRVIEIIRYDDDPKAALMYEDWSKPHQASLTRAMDESQYRSPLTGVDISSLTLISEADAAATGILAETAPEREMPQMYEGRENGLSDVQAEAILNMRLRSLRRLEEEALVKERDDLMAERFQIEDLLEDDTVQWNAIASQLKEVKKTFGKEYEGAARRTRIEEAGEVEEVPLEAMIDREPITVVCSKMGWIRAMTGHIDLNRELKFKDGDGPRFIFHAETTDRLLVFGSNGRFYTLSAANLPGGRGMGEPLAPDGRPAQRGRDRLALHPPSRPQTAGRLFGGRRVPRGRGRCRRPDPLGPAGAQRAWRRARAHLQTGLGRPCRLRWRKTARCWSFRPTNCPEMGRGKGVRLQRYKDGGLSDATTFDLAEGLSWLDPAGRTRTETNLEEWLGKRAGAGRMAPRGFPRDNTFT